MFHDDLLTLHIPANQERPLTWRRTSNSVDGFRYLIGGGWFTITTSMTLSLAIDTKGRKVRPLVVCDEDAMVKDLKPNPRASWWWGLGVLRGDCFIVAEELTGDREYCSLEKEWFEQTLKRHAITVLDQP